MRDKRIRGFAKKIDLIAFQGKIWDFLESRRRSWLHDMVESINAYTLSDASFGKKPDEIFNDVCLIRDNLTNLEAREAIEHIINDLRSIGRKALLSVLAAWIKKTERYNFADKDCLKNFPEMALSNITTLGLVIFEEEPNEVICVMTAVCARAIARNYDEPQMYPRDHILGYNEPARR